MNGKNASIKQAWVSVVDAQNIKDAKREAGKKLWFSLSPGKERFKYFYFFDNFRSEINQNCEFWSKMTIFFYFEPKKANSIFGTIDTRIWVLRSIVPKNKYQRTWPWLELTILPTFGHITLTGRWRCWFWEVNYNWSPHRKDSKSLDGFNSTGNWTGWF